MAHFHGALCIRGGIPHHDDAPWHSRRSRTSCRQNTWRLLRPPHLWLGSAGAFIVAAFNVLYFRYILKKAKAKGEKYEEPAPGVLGAGVAADGPMPNVWLSLIPPIIVLVLLNTPLPYIKKDVVLALTGGVLACIILFWKYFDNILDTLNKGAVNTVIPIVNTCADVGYGMAVAATAGFKVVSAWLLTLPMHPIISLSVATNIMAAITGSASGGLGIILETMAPKYLALGLSPDLIHRIAAMSSGAFDAMPHNGAVITMLAVCRTRSRQRIQAYFLRSCRRNNHCPVLRNTAGHHDLRLVRLEGGIRRSPCGTGFTRK